MPGCSRDAIRSKAFCKERGIPRVVVRGGLALSVRSFIPNSHVEFYRATVTVCDLGSQDAARIELVPYLPGVHPGRYSLIFAKRMPRGQVDFGNCRHRIAITVGKCTTQESLKETA